VNGRAHLRFATTITVVVFILVSSSKVLRIIGSNLSIGHVVANTRVKLIKGLPLKLVPLLREMSGSCDSALESGSPDGEWMLFALKK
jgi:hypothetical protein